MSNIRENRKEVGGYLTVYAALSLSVLLSLFFALLGGVRAHTFQLEAQLVADVAADSVLAEYHRELFRQYGMFWVDLSYGTSTPSLQTMNEHLQYYVNANCHMEEVFLGDYLYKDYLGMQMEDTAITGIALACDEGGRVFRGRAAEVMLADTGIAFLQQIIGWLETVERYHLLESSLEEDKQDADSKIEEMDGQEKQVGEDWITIEAENPTVPIQELKSKGILSLVLKEPEKVSANSVDPESLISHRKIREGINQGNLGSGKTEDLTDRLLWLEYLMRYCGYWGQPKEEGVLQYQLEYLIGGKGNDTENLKGVVHRICAVREAANMIYLFSDETKYAGAETTATVIATATFLPELQPVFLMSILLGWAYAESLYDVKCLLEGKEVPLLKSSETWHYDMDAVLGGIWGNGQGGSAEENGAENGQDGRNGLKYADYLRLLLVLSPLEEQTFRMMDIVEMDVRQTVGNTCFRMDGCADRFVAEISLKSAYGYRITVQKNKRY